MSAAGIDQGVVTRVDGHLAHVELESGDACESCGARSLCVPLSGGTRSIVAGLIGLGSGGVLAWLGIKRLSRQPGRFFTVRPLHR